MKRDLIPLALYIIGSLFFLAGSIGALLNALEKFRR